MLHGTVPCLSERGALNNICGWPFAGALDWKVSLCSPHLFDVDSLFLEGGDVGLGGFGEVTVPVTPCFSEINEAEVWISFLVSDERLHEHVAGGTVRKTYPSQADLPDGGHAADGVGQLLHVGLIFLEPNVVVAAVEGRDICQGGAVAKSFENDFTFATVFEIAVHPQVDCF